MQNERWQNAVNDPEQNPRGKILPQGIYALQSLDQARQYAGIDDPNSVPQDVWKIPKEQINQLALDPDLKNAVAPSPVYLTHPIVRPELVEAHPGHLASLGVPEDSPYEAYDPQVHPGEFYHQAPTADRERVRTHGLIQSDPHLTWGAEYGGQPEGVYMADDPRDTMGFGQGDIWKVNPAHIQQIGKDPAIPWGSWIVPHNIPPEALELSHPYETTSWGQTNDDPYEWGKPQDAPDEFSANRGVADYKELQNNRLLSNPWGIGFPDRVIGRVADAADELAFYHAAPTSERARILQHGLQVSDPRFDPRYFWNENPGRVNPPPKEEMPQGVYVTPNIDRANSFGTRWHENPDIWKVPAQKEELEYDPDGMAYYLKRPVPDPELVRGPQDSDEESYERSRQHSLQNEMDAYQRNKDAWGIGQALSFAYA
jgi:hypothetical protein